MLPDGRRCDEELDKFALTACQHYNLANASNWFFSFRGGHYGVLSRVTVQERRRTARRSSTRSMIALVVQRNFYTDGRPAGCECLENHTAKEWQTKKDEMEKDANEM